ncbi:MAG: putative bifunctional diguanylate cyclase/phosphodiesterase [Elstera sp.]
MVAQPTLSQVADSGPSGVLAAAYDRLPVAMLCVRDKVVLYANIAAADLLGIELSGLIGAAWASLLKPDAPETLDLGRMAKTHPAETFTLPGSCCGVCEVSVSPAPTGRAGDWLVCLRPLHPASGEAGVIFDQQAILSHLIDSVGDAVLVVAEDGRIIDLNKGAQRVFAVDRQPARGMSIWPLLAPTLFEGEETLPEASVQMLLRAVPRSTLGTGRSMTLSRADGISFPGEIAITPLPLPNCAAHLVTVRDVSDRKRIESRLERLALYDPLTRLPNRVKVLQHLERLIAQSPASTIVAVAIDVDHFKYVNDFFGHGPGDRLLQAVGGRLGGDLEEGDLLGHLGGDDFLIISATNDPVATIERLARRVEEASARTFLIDQSELFISLSQGIALYPDHATDPSNLLTAAQAATYEAKAAGRATTVIYSERVRDRRAGRLAIETDLRRAVERGELSIEYQPRLSVEGHRLLGMEALLRWDHPEMGRIPPSHFIPIAEESGLIVPIGHWVLETACKQARAWTQAGFPKLKVAINLSVRQFRDAGLLSKVVDALDASGLPAENLELEITESGLMSDLDRAIDLLEDLKRIGITIAIDDFGTGYSSLSYLKRLPIDLLKIDRSFIAGLSENADDRAICQAIVSMAFSLGLETVAEGVETEGQLECLREIGCHEVQGYLFARPLSVTDFSAYLPYQHV